MPILIMTRSASSSKDLKFPWPSNFLQNMLLLEPYACPLCPCLTSCAMALVTSCLNLLCVLSSSPLSNPIFWNFSSYCEGPLFPLTSRFISSTLLVLLCEALATPSVPELRSASSAAVYPLQSCIFVLASSLTFSEDWSSAHSSSSCNFMAEPCHA